MKWKNLIGFLCLALILSGGNALAETVESVTSAETYTPNTYEPDPCISGNVSIADYLNTYESSGVFTYESDGGDKTSLPFDFDLDYKNPICVRPDYFVSTGYLQGNVTDSSDDGTLWVNTSAWIVEELYTSAVGTGTLTKITENGIKKLKFQVVGNDSSFKSYRWTFNLSSITEDVAKQRIIFGVDVDFPTDTAGSFVRFTIYDKDGDSRYFELNDNNASTLLNVDGVIFHSLVINDFSHGSGTMDSIDQVEIRVQDQNDSAVNTITMEMFALQIGKKPITFGSDSTGTDVVNMTEGDNGVVCMKTFNPSFKYESIASLGPIAFHAPASKLDKKYTNVSVADYTGGDYVKKVIYSLSMNVPKAIDLTYAGLTLEDKLLINSQQYDYVSASGTQMTGTYTGARKGDTITVLDTVNEGTQYPMELEILFTGEQWEGISEQVGALTSDSSAWWNEWWLWFASLVGIGYGVKRKRKNA